MSLNREVPAHDFGYDVVQAIKGEVTFADNGTAVLIGTVPANSLILKPASGLHVTTAFNAGTNNFIDIGTPANDDLFGTDLSGAAANFVPLDEAIGGYFVTEDTEIIATVGLTGTAATAGVAKVVITYVKF